MKSFGVSPPADDRTEWDGVSIKRSTDLVSLSQWKSLRNAVVALLSGVPSTLLEVGLPTGGSTGQALTKTSGTDGAVGWATISTGSGSGAVSSVSGRTGAVTLTKSDVALANVDNTPDTDKPISSATASALSGKSATGHAHTASDITSGTLATARLASGTASSSSYLRGDQTWASAPAAANGIPSGGTTGQTLQKTSGSDYATGWATVTSSGTVADASTTTKGILILTGDLGGTASSPTVPGLANKAALVHTHSISDVSDLQTQLNQKAPTTRGLPSGGTTGQVLAKSSATAYDATWVTPSTSSGGTTSGSTVTVETDSSRPNVLLLRISDGTSSGTLPGSPGQPTVTAA